MAAVWIWIIILDNKHYSEEKVRVKTSDLSAFTGALRECPIGSHKEKNHELASEAFYESEVGWTA